MADTWYPEASQEQKDAQEEQERRERSSIPAIQDILDWYDERIAYFRSPDCLAIDMNTDPATAKQVALTCKHFSAVYIDERRDFANRFAKYIQEVEA